MSSKDNEQQLIYFLEEIGYVDMSTLNTDVDYKMPTYGFNPFLTKKQKIYTASHFIRLEMWNLNK